MSKVTVHGCREGLPRWEPSWQRSVPRTFSGEVSFDPNESHFISVPSLKVPTDVLNIFAPPPWDSMTNEDRCFPGR